MIHQYMYGYIYSNKLFTSPTLIIRVFFNASCFGSFLFSVLIFNLESRFFTSVKIDFIASTLEAVNVGSISFLRFCY